MRIWIAKAPGVCEPLRTVRRCDGTGGPAQVRSGKGRVIGGAAPVKIALNQIEVSHRTKEPNQAAGTSRTGHAASHATACATEPIAAAAAVGLP